MATVTYAAFTAAEYVVEGHLRDELERRRMDRAISDLFGHTIVCGYGRVGRHLASTLDRDGAPFVVVDTDDDKLDELEERGYLRVRGDATEEHVLAEAGMARASALVACVNSDADNVLVTLTAKGMRPDCVVIARCKADENERKLQRAGADRVISPSTIGGRRIAQILTRPAVADFLDGIAGGATDYTLEEVTVAAGGELDGMTLREAGIRERFRCTVLALRHATDRRLDSAPGARPRPLAVGDVLVVMGLGGRRGDPAQPLRAADPVRSGADGRADARRPTRGVAPRVRSSSTATHRRAVLSPAAGANAACPSPSRR